MEILSVDEENENSRLAQLNDQCAFRIEDIRTLHPREVKYCRLCALPHPNPVYIFDKQGLRMNLAKKINRNLPIMVTENSRLPLHVCWDCIKQLNASINFVNQCIGAQAKIERIFKSMIEEDFNTGPSISNEINFQVEPLKSTSSSLSNQLLSKDGCIDGEGENIIEISTRDSSKSSNLHCNNQNRLLSPFSETKDKEGETATNGMFLEKCVANSCDREEVSEDREDVADQFVENLEDNYFVLEQGLDKNNDGYSFKEAVQYNLKNISPSDGSPFKQINKNWLWCKYCNRYFLSEENLNQHQILTHPTLVFQCSYCSKIFYEIKADFIRHENSHACPPKKKKSGKSKCVVDTIDHSEECTSNTVFDSKISHLPYEKQQWIKEILLGHLPESDSNGNEVLVSNVENEKNLRKEEDGSCNTVPSDNFREDIIERSSDDVILNEQKRTSSENMEVVEKSEQFSLLRVKIVQQRKLKKYSCFECKVEFITKQELRKHDIHYHIPRHPCRFCPRTLSYRKELKRHELNHISGENHKCRRCSESFNTFDELEKHKKSKHIDNPPFRCETCKKPYVLEHVYLEHVKLHSLGNCFLCEMCGKAFSLKTTLNSHRKMYCMNRVEKKLSCQYCGRKFYHNSHLKVHVRTHTGEKRYLCSVCGKQFSELHHLKYHQDIHSVFKNACSFCGQLFLHNKGLVSHLKRHVKCRICFVVFNNKVKEHLLHRREFHATEVEEELEKGFGGEKLVELADGGGKRGDFSKTVVKCEKCKRNFASVFWLQLHQKGGCIFQPIFKCPICEKITRSEDSYRKHMMLHSKNKSLQCSHCLQTFCKHKDLLEHEKEHKVSKTFSCPECGRGFRSSHKLAKHLIAHSTGKMHSCKHCDEYFSSPVLLLLHERKHNSDYKQVSPNPISINKSLPRHTQILEVPHFMEQVPSNVNTTMLNEDYIINICQTEGSYAGDVENVAGEVLVYDS